ncbi:MAG: ABC transporter permease subunit [Bacillota bacterium]|nr:ABC transporter permease subunit [Bacillota bacterium]
MWRRAAWRQRYLLILALPAVVWLLVFHYVPILGLQIAFKDFRFRTGIWGSQWSGLKHFLQLFRDITIVNAVRNTFAISLMKLVLLFPIPIAFALLINEIRFHRFKRVIQTVSYFPHFIAYSVVALMISILLAKNGIVNDLLLRLGLIREPYLFLGEKNAFWWIMVVTDGWKSTGWNSIIYIAALTAVPLELYEAATIDGANRYQKILRITLPYIKPTVVMLLIINMGNIVRGASFDMSYLLGNPLNMSHSEILPTYVMRTGIGLGRFSYATAVGIVQSIVSMILVVSANALSRYFSDEGLF